MNILTFDIEDWWVYDHYKIGAKPDWLPRLDNYLSIILEILDTRSIRATFFILGILAKSYPEIVSRIASHGHHIGCHSYAHRFWREATQTEVSEDTRIALDTIENVVGKKVDAYRAPAFSITEKNSRILVILAENGIKYDCSIFPSERSFGGFSGYKTKSPSIIHLNGISIKEFPIAPATILGREIVFSGGGYFRMFPYWKIKSLILKNDYVMTYFHIKDFDKDQTRTFRALEGESALLRYIKKYYGLNSCFSKFCKLISEVDFVSVVQADKMLDWSVQPQINLNDE